MRDIVLVSFTRLDANGGVPRWNRDFIAGFPGTRHYSYEDFVNNAGTMSDNIPTEWSAAAGLNMWLHRAKKVKKDDIIISDGFWGEGLSSLGYNVISVAHGIWSHLTKEDVDVGRQPEFPVHHAVQVKHRHDHLSRGGKIVAVSRFIQEQMGLQWGFESSVINNAVDLDEFTPNVPRMIVTRPLVIHGVTTSNKGFDHIKKVKEALEDRVEVLLLDDAARELGMGKYQALAHADLVVQPSAFEGNSYFVLETLACDVPIVAYDVGLLHSISTISRENGIQACVGAVIDRKYRSPEETAKVSSFILDSVRRDRSVYNPREVAKLFSIQRFHQEWKRYLEDYERRLESR